MSFQERAKMLDELGVKYNVEYEYRGEVGKDRKKYDLDIFTRVYLPLTNNELCELFMSEGKFYLGGCCGSFSRLQDIVCSILRYDSGWFSIEKLREIGEIITDHDGEDEDSAMDGVGLPGGLTFKHLPKNKSLKNIVRNFIELRDGNTGEIDPWKFMALVWHITKDHYGPAVPNALDHLSELDRSVFIVSHALININMDRFFDDSLKKESQRKASRSMLLYRMLPAWKTLNEKIGDLNLGSIEGFALIEKEVGPEAICTNRLGYCIYDNQADVDEVLNLWRNKDSEHKERDIKPVDERIGVRRVRVSADKGIEFLGD